MLYQLFLDFFPTGNGAKFDPAGMQVMPGEVKVFACVM